MEPNSELQIKLRQRRARMGEETSLVEIANTVLRPEQETAPAGIDIPPEFSIFEAAVSKQTRGRLTPDFPGVKQRRSIFEDAENRNGGKPANFVSSPPLGKLRDALKNVSSKRRQMLKDMELTFLQILEEKRKELCEERAASEALSRQLSCVQTELGNCRESLQAKIELAENNARERDLVQARYETICEQNGAMENQQMQAITELKVIVGNLSSELESTKLEMRAKELNETDQQAQILALQRRMLEQEEVRREQHNAIQDLKANIRVIGRTWPVAKDGAPTAVRVSEGTGKMSVLNGDDTHNFEFDNVFGCDSTQQRLYGEAAPAAATATTRATRGR